MAKRTYTHEVDPKTGKPVVTELKNLTRAQRKSLTLIPFTKAPSKIARILWH
jgi:hypothetical protein